MGQVAVMKASNLEFVEDSGKVTQEIGKEQVAELLDTFKELQGQGAIGIARRGFEDGELEEEDIDLPDSLTA